MHPSKPEKSILFAILYFLIIKKNIANIIDFSGLEGCIKIGVLTKNSRL